MQYIVLYFVDCVFLGFKVGLVQFFKEIDILNLLLHNQILQSFSLRVHSIQKCLLRKLGLETNSSANVYTILE